MAASTTARTLLGISWAPQLEVATDSETEPPINQPVNSALAQRKVAITFFSTNVGPAWIVAHGAFIFNNGDVDAHVSPFLRLENSDPEEAAGVEWSRTGDAVGKSRRAKPKLVSGLIPGRPIEQIGAGFHKETAVGEPQEIDA